LKEIAHNVLEPIPVFFLQACKLNVLLYTPGEGPGAVWKRGIKAIPDYYKHL